MDSQDTMILRRFANNLKIHGTKSLVILSKKILDELYNRTKSEDDINDEDFIGEDRTEGEDQVQQNDDELIDCKCDGLCDGSCRPPKRTVDEYNKIKELLDRELDEIQQCISQVI